MIMFFIMIAYSKDYPLNNSVSLSPIIYTIRHNSSQVILMYSTIDGLVKKGISIYQLMHLKDYAHHEKSRTNGYVSV